MQPHATLDNLCDDELLRRLDELVSDSRRVEADLVAHIGEVERRGLYAREASPSMFAYCRERLHLSEAEAYMRIRVARAARRHALLLEMLRDGRLHLSGIVRLLPVLTRDNRDALLARASFCSKRQILELVAELSPRPDVPARMRKLPQQRLALLPPKPPSTAVWLSPGGGDTPVRRLEADPEPDRAAVERDRAAVDRAERLCPDTVAAASADPPSSSARRALVEPLSPGRYKVQFTASAELHAKLERLRALMRSHVPEGDLAAIIDHAVSQTLARLEFHHRHPFGMGGDHDPGNVGLLCRAHNQLVARSDYGLLATTRRGNRPQAGASPP